MRCEPRGAVSLFHVHSHTQPDIGAKKDFLPTIYTANKADRSAQTSVLRPSLTHTSHLTPMPGVSSWLTGWTFFLAGWSLFLSGWLSKPHTSHLRYHTSDVAPLTSYIKLQTSHLTADLTLHTSVLRPPTSHLKDLRPATSGPTPQTSLLRPRTETSTSHLRLHISELGPQTSPYLSEYYFVLLFISTMS